MRSRSRLLLTLLLMSSIANGASADSADRLTASESAASDEITYVSLDLNFERVVARIDREIAAMLQPSTVDCSSGTGVAGIEVCVVRLESAIAAVVPAAPAHN